VPYASDPMVARRAALVGLVGLSALGASPEVRSDDLDSFTGSFSGTGMVVEGPNATRHQVRCVFNSSQQGVSRLALRGTCWAYAIIPRSISADLVVDGATGRVLGTYTGARVGPARLSGKRQGSAIDLLITWPQPVFGSMTARMTISNPEPKGLRILVLSRVGQNGIVRATTDLVLNRR
jgi:hypothetical protein